MDYYGDLGIFLSLTPIIASLCFALALLTNRARTKPQAYLAASFLVMGTGMLISFWVDRYTSVVHPDVFRPTNIIGTYYCNLSILFYFISLLQPHLLSRKFLTWFISGSILFTSMAGICSYYFPGIAPMISAYIIIAFEVGSSGVVIYKYYVHKKMIRENYSYKEDINLKWILWMISLFIILGFGDALWTLDGSVEIKIFFNLVSTVGLTALFLLGYRQGDLPVFNKIPIASRENESEVQESDKTSTSRTSEKQNKLEAALFAYFQEHSPYLNPDLSLTDVSEAVGVNGTYLSKLINGRFNINFYTFVNNYRIDYAIHLIREKEGNITSDLLYMESGFKSRSVFYKLFRERTGLSPQDYIRSTGLSQK